MGTSKQDRDDPPSGASGGAYEREYANGRPERGDRWLRSVVENSSEIVKVIDPDGTLKYANPAFGRVLGHDPEEALGTNVFDHVHPDDLARVLEGTEKALSAGGVATDVVEYRVRHKDGSWLWMEETGTYLPDDPAVRGVVVNARDVTERKEAERRLVESERRFSSVVFNAHAYAYRCLNEPGWPNEYASDYALHLTGYPPEDLLVGGEVQLGDLIVEEDRARVWDEVQEALAEGRGFELRYAIRRRDGQIRQVHEYGRGVCGEDGEVVALEGLLYDVTERRKAEEALKESEERHRIQSRELFLLHQVRSALAQELDLPTVFRTVVEATAETYGYTQASAYLLEGEDLLLQHQVGYEQVIERIPLTEGVSGRAVRTGRPVLLEVVRSDPGFLGAIEGITSEICVPLFDEDQAVGCFNVESTGGVKLTQKDLELMVALGEHVSVAVSRARLHIRVRNSEEHFRALTQNSSDIVTLLRAVGTIRYQSPSVERILGYRPEEMIGDNTFDYIHPDDRERAEMAFAEGLIDHMRHPLVEYRYRHKDGSWVWLESVGTNLLGNPEVGEYVVNSRDVTERREAEEALKESEERFRSTFEDAPIGVALVGLPSSSPDSDRRYLRVNRALCEMLGYSEEELLSKISSDVTHPGDLEKSRARAERLLGEGGTKYTMEKRYVRSDGRVVWAMLNVSLVRDSEGNPSHFVSQYQDVMERKETEQTLRKGEALLAESQRIAHLGTWEWDVVTGEAWWSDETYRIHGFEPGERINLREKVEEAFFPEDLPRYRRKIDEALSGEAEGYDHEHRIRRLDGQVRWVHGQAEAVRGEGGEPLRMIGTVHDTTERKEAETGLREAEERYRTLVERIPAVTFVDRAEGSDTPLYVSPQIQDMLGYTPEEWMEGRLWRGGLHPEDRERILASDERFEADGGQVDEEYRLLAKDGTVVWVREETVLMRGEGGEPLYVQGILSDVTGRKVAEEALKESEGRFRALTQNSSDLITLLEADGTAAYQSPAIRRLLGYSSEELIGENVFGYMHPKDVERVRTAFAEGLEDPGRRPSVEYRFLRKDGSWAWLESVGTDLIDHNGVGKYVVNSRDITDRKETERLLREAEERYRAVVEEQTELVCRFLPDLTLTFVNDAYCRYFGKGQEELIGGSFLEHIPSEDHPYYEGQLSGLGQRNPTRTVEHRVFTPGGEVRWQQWTDTAVFDGEGRVVEYQSVGRDVTERRALEERLEHQALHDSLTGLPNRRLFVDRLGQALARTRRRRGKRVAVLYMDLDGFKVVNDSLGHEAGDLLLVVVAERLRRSLRPEDTLARFGGDEFVVLVEDVDSPGEAVRVAERITGELRRPLTVGGRELYARASIGMALGDARSKAPEDLVRDADTAMYRAKEEGSGHLLFNPAMYERAVSRLELENDLRRAIEQREFVVHYQPIISLETDEVWGLEALVRWEHPERGLLDPGEFVPIAEESGLVVPIGEAVLEEACRRAKGWQEERPHVPPLVMSVNLSARQLSRPDLAETVEGVLRSTGFEGNCLCLDVTETVYVRALEGNTRALDRLRNMGVRISIDDFGTGYSSLSYLKRLPADAIKIDKSFVKGLGEDVEDTAIVRMVIELAHTLGVEVVAEGVESRAQAALLAEMGCDMAQGYHFSRPLPPEAATEFLAE